jgi:hypothetical protein
VIVFLLLGLQALLGVVVLALFVVVLVLSLVVRWASRIAGGPL